VWCVWYGENSSAETEPPAIKAVVPRQLDATTRQQIEARLTRLHNACGCGAGTLALLITLAIWAMMWRMQPDPLAHSGLMLSLGLILAVLSVGLGKWFGLWRAKHTLVAELQHLAQRLETAHATHPV